MTGENLRIDIDRLLGRLERLGEIGALEGGGVCRLALSSEDQQGRDLVVDWMKDLGLRVDIDGIGNIIALRPGRREGPPVMTGSHIDTVRTGGRYDGCLGVLGGLEVVQALNGGLALDEALATQGIDGENLEECLDAIGYRGSAPCGSPAVKAFVELHVEQGPVLEAEGIAIGAVEKVQGISWREYRIEGVSNHAGTTPMSLRHDAGYAAAAIACEARRLAGEMGGDQVATVGRLELSPNLVNVVANQALLTLDLRNTDERALQQAETRLAAFIERLGRDEGLIIESRSLARFEPVEFDRSLVARVEGAARELGLSVKRMPSGAGHDAQMLARVCPAGMIFVPSVGGVSHNVRDFTEARDLEAGANVLLKVLLDLAGSD
jgi:N-carbamoyl-L-amino-acid hydrolase